jgi:simple sugar transport system ATP-binding protein
MESTTPLDARERDSGVPVTPPSSTGLLEARGITKSFNHVEALRGVDFSLARSEIVGLVGDNGAGKSTLVKVLSGAIQPDGGGLWFDGDPVTFESPAAARDHGIETVYQDLALADDLDPAANLFLGREVPLSGIRGRLGCLDKRKMREQSAARFEELGVRVSTMRGSVAGMSGGQRQGIAVARAVAWAGKVVFMDEPTAALGVVQTKAVLEIIRRVRDSGRSVVLISHSMPEVLEVVDRVQVLRLGRRVANLLACETSSEEIVGYMTGAIPSQEALS